jgi:hypothetical protein
VLRARARAAAGIDDDEPEPFEAFLFDPKLEEGDGTADMETS